MCLRPFFFRAAQASCRCHYLRANKERSRLPSSAWPSIGLGRGGARDSTLALRASRMPARRGGELSQRRRGRGCLRTSAHIAHVRLAHDGLRAGEHCTLAHCALRRHERERDTSPALLASRDWRSAYSRHEHLLYLCAKGWPSTLLARLLLLLPAAAEASAAASAQAQEAEEAAPQLEVPLLGPTCEPFTGKSPASLILESLLWTFSARPERGRSLAACLTLRHICTHPVCGEPFPPPNY